MLKKLVNNLRNSVELERRIKYRHRTFWKDEAAEEIRKGRMEDFFSALGKTGALRGLG